MSKLALMKDLHLGWEQLWLCELSGIVSSMDKGQYFSNRRGSYTSGQCCPNIYSKKLLYA